MTDSPAHNSTEIEASADIVDSPQPGTPAISSPGSPMESKRKPVVPVIRGMGQEKDDGRRPLSARSVGGRMKELAEFAEGLPVANRNQEDANKRKEFFDRLRGKNMKLSFLRLEEVKAQEMVDIPSLILRKAFIFAKTVAPKPTPLFGQHANLHRLSHGPKDDLSLPEFRFMLMYIQELLRVQVVLEVADVTQTLDLNDAKEKLAAAGYPDAVALMNDSGEKSDCMAFEKLAHYAVKGRLDSRTAKMAANKKNNTASITSLHTRSNMDLSMLRSLSSTGLSKTTPRSIPKEGSVRKGSLTAKPFAPSARPLVKAPSSATTADAKPRPKLAAAKAVPKVISVTPAKVGTMTSIVPKSKLVDELRGKAAAKGAAAPKASASGSFASKTSASMDVKASAAKAKAKSRFAPPARSTESLCGKMAKLPTTTEGQKKLFDKFDSNATGKLSLSEIEAGLAKILPGALDTGVTSRAYEAAKGKAEDGDNSKDPVDSNEFPTLLVYLRRYAELRMMFQRDTTNGDVTAEEFARAQRRLATWGVKVPDPATAFTAMDEDLKGAIPFNDFCHWAIKVKLDNSDEDGRESARVSTASHSYPAKLSPGAAAKNSRSAASKSPQRVVAKPALGSPSKIVQGSATNAALGPPSKIAQGSSSKPAKATQGAPKAAKSSLSKATQGVALKAPPSGKSSLVTGAPPAKISPRVPPGTGKPVETSPKPPPNSPKPPANSGKPVETAPKPPPNSPKPLTDSPKPTFRSPKLGQTSLKPPPSVPKPPPSSPKPAVRSPKTAARSPKPAQSSPKVSPQKEPTISPAVWQKLAIKLPSTKKDAEQRKKLFNEMDINGNGYLSLAEIDAGLKKVLACDTLFGRRQVTMRAYQAAKDLHKGQPGSVGADYVEWKEFRMLLVYLRDYFELHVMFSAIDETNDGRISKEEFVDAAPQLSQWGAKIDDPNETFAKIDSDGHGMVLFDEFCDWAIKQKLDLTDDDNANEMDVSGHKTSAEVLQAEQEAGQQRDSQGSGRKRRSRRARKRKSRNSNSSTADVWRELSEKLPTDKNEESLKRRRDLFRQMDPNGNGYLSLAEIDGGMKSVLNCDTLFNTKQVTMRAYQAAKDLHKGQPGSVGENYVEWREFRMLLVYLRDYFELHVMFTKIDDSSDGRISKQEFVEATPELVEWGAKIDDAGETFAKIDSDGHGMVLFDEFCDWAIKQKLDLSDDDDSNEMDIAGHKKSAEVLEKVRKASQKRSSSSSHSSSVSAQTWEELAAMLPAEREDDARRKEMFEKMDENDTGYLNLAEIDKGLQTFLNSTVLTQYEDVTQRAYKSAKALHPGTKEDVLAYPEFASFLYYVRSFAELQGKYNDVNRRTDSRLNYDDFTSVSAVIAEWGATDDDNDLSVAFKDMDEDNIGSVPFDEFCHWAATKRLALRFPLRWGGLSF